jgi:acetyl-CoA synthetase
LIGAEELLNPEIITQVHEAWGLTLRDGFGQTETTAQVGNTPGQRDKPGSTGRPLPGYRLRLLDADGRDSSEGEVCLDLVSKPLGLMRGYQDDGVKTMEVMRDGAHHTGDLAFRDYDGYITFVGRSTTSSRRRTIASASSNSRVQSWSMQRWSKLPCFRARVRYTLQFQRRV